MFAVKFIKGITNSHQFRVATSPSQPPFRDTAYVHVQRKRRGMVALRFDGCRDPRPYAGKVAKVFRPAVSGDLYGASVQVSTAPRVSQASPCGEDLVLTCCGARFRCGVQGGELGPVCNGSPNLGLGRHYLTYEYLPPGRAVPPRDVVSTISPIPGGKIARFCLLVLTVCVLGYQAAGLPALTTAPASVVST